MTYPNVEALRADAKRLKSFLKAEQQIRARLADNRPQERDKWLRKYQESCSAADALERLMEYIAGTDPTGKLGTLPTQRELFPGQQ